MNFQVITLFPEMILSGLKEGVVSTSIDNKIISIECLNPRKFSEDAHHTVDDRPFGGGDGMIMMAEPLERSIAHFEDRGELIYLSARGEVFNDKMARELSQKKTLTLICGRYGGVDQRVLVKNKVREVSIGDYILSGGELAALVMIDSVARHLPGVLGNFQSADQDSFAQGLLEAPAFTRARDWGGIDIPAVLLSGDHKKTKEWRENLAILSTIQNRPDLFLKKDLSLKTLESARVFFEKMRDAEKQVCGLTQQVLVVLNESLARKKSL